MIIEDNNYKNWKQKFRVPVLLVIYLIYLFIFTLAPFEFSTSWFKKMFAGDISDFFDYIFYLQLYDFIDNVILFIPFGILIYYLIRHTRLKKDRRCFIIAVSSGIILSGIIEGAQLFSKRSSSFIDLLTNTGGTVLGFYMAEKWIPVIMVLLKRLFKRKNLLVILSTTLIYSIIFVILCFLPYKLNDLRNWNEEFRLFIGNEKTLDRSWDGEIFLAAIYDWALRSPDIKELYELGLDKVGQEERKKHGLLAFYNFSECSGDTIYDLSDYGSPLHLVGKGFKWLDRGKGIQIKKGLLYSLKPAKKITRANSETSQMTVEVWVRTGNLIQSGPARIVSLSENTGTRNFTLGQSGRNIHFRIRTPLTGLNGSLINLEAESVLNDLEPHHLVATFNRGVEKLYVDGQLASDIIEGNIGYLPFLVNMGQNTTAKLAFCFGFLFPLSLLVYNLFRKWHFIFTLIWLTGLVVLTELFYCIRLDQPFGFLFTCSALTSAVIGGFVGYIFRGN